MRCGKAVLVKLTKHGANVHLKFNQLKTYRLALCDFLNGKPGYRARFNLNGSFLATLIFQAKSEMQSQKKKPSRSKSTGLVQV